MGRVERTGGKVRALLDTLYASAAKQRNLRTWRLNYYEIIGSCVMIPAIGKSISVFESPSQKKCGCVSAVPPRICSETPASSPAAFTRWNPSSGGRRYVIVPAGE